MSINWRTRLRAVLVEHFDEDGLRILCADLGVPADRVASESADLETRALKTVAYFDKRGWIPELVEGIVAARPDVPVREKIGPLPPNAFWWLRRNRWPVRAAAVSLAGVVALLAALRVWPFQDRLGWQQISDIQIGDAWRLEQIQGNLLAATKTTSSVCGADTGLVRKAAADDRWTSIAPPLEIVRTPVGCNLAAITGFASAPASALPRRVYASTTHVGLLRSDDAGLTWTRAGATTLAESKLAHVTTAPGDADSVFVAGWRFGLYRSNDGGDAWVRLDNRINDYATACPAGTAVLTPTLRIGALIATDRHLYIGTSKSRDALEAEPYDGLYVSLDRGECWRQLESAEERYSYWFLGASLDASDQVLAVKVDEWGLTKPMLHRYQLSSTPAIQQPPLWCAEGVIGIPDLPRALHVEVKESLAWYVTTQFGQVVRGDLASRCMDSGNQFVQRLPEMTRCFLALCPEDIAFAADVQAGRPPLLLANGQVYRLGIGSWFRTILP